MIIKKHTRAKLYKKWAMEYLLGKYAKVDGKHGICYRCRLCQPDVNWHMAQPWGPVAISPFPELNEIMQFSDGALSDDWYWKIDELYSSVVETNELRATVLLFCHYIALDATN